jgi:hypothetical protein
MKIGVQKRREVLFEPQRIIVYSNGECRLTNIHLNLGSQLVLHIWTTFLKTRNRCRGWNSG